MTSQHLTPDQRQMLRGMARHCYEDCCYSFRSLQRFSRLPQHKVRRVVRELARKRLARYEKGLMTDDGMVAGAGYTLTDAGFLHPAAKGIKLKGGLYWI